MTSLEEHFAKRWPEVQSTWMKSNQVAAKQVLMELLRAKGPLGHAAADVLVIAETVHLAAVDEEKG